MQKQGNGMSKLDIARGLVPGMRSENKWGFADSGIQATPTDVWDRADATPTQQIWVAPTEARLHNIVSSSTSDDGDPVGVGAQTVKIFGLTSWATAEVSETVTLNGTTDVATSNAYVIIYRMKVQTWGATNINVGTITATAQTDSTVTAAILPGIGSTQMAIYGIPSIQKAYLTAFSATILKSSGSTAAITYRLLINDNPTVELTNFRSDHAIGVQSNGKSSDDHPFDPEFEIEGPAIIKMNGIASAADISGSADFDIIVVDN